jgi:hypothetical protein
MKALFEGVIKGERGVGMVMVVGFMGLCVPMLVAALALGGALSHDSQVKNRLAKSQYSGIGALEYVRYVSESLSGDPGKLNDKLKEWETVGETLSLNEDTVQISASDAGLADQGFLAYCIFGTTSVMIKEYADINCSVGSNGNIEIKEDTVISGDVVSGGNVILKENSHVTGNVRAAGTITLKSGATVGGDICQGDGCFQPIGGPAPLHSVVITVTNANGSESQYYYDVESQGLPMTFDLEACANVDPIIVKAGQSKTLEPGCYGNVDVRENATLNLYSNPNGDNKYAFVQFTIKESTIINLDVSNGPIVFDAVDRLEFKENIVMNVIGGGNAMDFVVRVADWAMFKEDGQYVGTYFGFGADNAEMHVKENSTLTGALYGDVVEVKENTEVYGMPAIGAYLAFFGQN